MTDTTVHDLRSFFHQVGHFSGERALTTTPFDRPLTDADVELLDDPEPVEVTADPVEPGGFVDGIQAALLVTHNNHRPVYLNYVAAGCLAPNGRLGDLHESIFVSGSVQDQEWFDALDCSLPWVGLTATRPDEVAPEAMRLIGNRRDDAERALVESLVGRGLGPIVVDGHLASRPEVDEIVGVIKTARTRYLPDESLLWGMRAGYRSPRFKIPAGTMGVGRDRFSCYLRLHDAARHGWDFGLIRLEAYDPALLPGIAAMALRERQSSRAKDARFDRHLAGVRAVEDALRARRPAVFSM